MKENNLPSFVIPGFGKSGTTTIHYLLRDHSQVCLPKMKEAHFFDVEENYRQGKDYYRAFFSHAQPSQILGDITPAYITRRKFLARMQSTLGEGVKIIIVLRHPVIRAFSHYIHGVRLFSDSGRFHQNGKIINDWYKHCSSYKDRLADLYSFFPKENILHLIFERDIMRDSRIAIKKICEYIGLDADIGEGTGVVANTGYLPRVSIIESDMDVCMGASTTSLKKGDIIAEHIRVPEGYSIQRLTNEQLLVAKKGFVCELTKNDLFLLQEEFSKDIDFVRTSLNDPIDEWEVENVELPKYSVVESKLPIGMSRLLPT